MNTFNLNSIKKKLSNAPDIIGKSKYFNSAVLIPLITIEDQLHILFEKRAAGIRQGGEVSFPGGQFDPDKDKTFLNTAIRETREELGITEEQIEIITKFGTLVAPMGLTIDAFLAFINITSLSELKIDQTEVEKIFTLPLSYFMENDPEIFYSRLEIHTVDNDANGKSIELLPVKKFGLPEFYSSPWKNGKYRVIVYNTEPDVLWGLTAEIVYELSRILKDGE
ncbi:MAG: CoA pyrophosphatase [Ignavibacteriaceae bacterium]|nr:CoA pyrophosphatase [Ignavibacteriaceae bacterium]